MGRDETTGTPAAMRAGTVPPLAECDRVFHWHARQELTDRLRSEPFGIHSRFPEHTAGVFWDWLRPQPSATYLEHLTRPESEQRFSDLAAVGVGGIEKDDRWVLPHAGATYWGYRAASRSFLRLARSV